MFPRTAVSIWKIVFLIFTTEDAKAALTGSNICPGESKSEATTCCYNYHEENGVCVECPAGTYGNQCRSICGNGFYGPKCRNTCSCSSPFEICDPKIGCTCPQDNPQCDAKELTTTSSMLMSNISRARTNITDRTTQLPSKLYTVVYTSLFLVPRKSPSLSKFTKISTSTKITPKRNMSRDDVISGKSMLSQEDNQDIEESNNTEMITVIAITASVVLVVCVIIFILVMFARHKLKKSRKRVKEDNSNPRDSSLIKSKIYDEINDTQMCSLSDSPLPGPSIGKFDEGYETLIDTRAKKVDLPNKRGSYELLDEATKGTPSKSRGSYQVPNDVVAIANDYVHPSKIKRDTCGVPGKNTNTDMTEKAPTDKNQHVVKRNKSTKGDNENMKRTQRNNESGNPPPLPACRTNGSDSLPRTQTPAGDSHNAVVGETVDKKANSSVKNSFFAIPPLPNSKCASNDVRNNDEKKEGHAVLEVRNSNNDSKPSVVDDSYDIPKQYSSKGVRRKAINGERSIDYDVPQNQKVVQNSETEPILATDYDVPLSRMISSKDKTSLCTDREVPQTVESQNEDYDVPTSRLAGSKIKNSNQTCSNKTSLTSTQPDYDVPLARLTAPKK